MPLGMKSGKKRIKNKKMETFFKPTKVTAPTSSLSEPVETIARDDPSIFTTVDPTCMSTSIPTLHSVSPPATNRI